VITIDPGHGGTDPGACGNGLREAEFTLEVAKLVAAGLRQYGEQVGLTRTEDATLLQPERVRLITAPADCVVSIHANSHACQPHAARGWEVFVSAFFRASEELGNSIAAAMRELPIPARDPAVRTRLRDHLTDWYYVIREPRSKGIPAVLIECGFISNPDDAAYLKSFWGRFQIAHAIAKGVLSWSGIHPAPDLLAKLDAADEKLARIKEIVG
jgi:N-acetylmuramoyl-L-alanine amidase